MTSSDEESDQGYAQTSFERTYRCYPVSFSSGKEFLESGNKILMPISALDTIASLDISYPMIFEIKNPSAKKASHCGVLEFTAEEGTIFLSHWMMQNLLLQEGDVVVLSKVTLPKATFMKLQPHTMNFLDLPYPKETLERTLLGSYSCLTSGDTIMITDNKKNYYIDVVETKPSRAVSVVDTDFGTGTNCEVDFAPPLDYKEPEKPAVSTPSRGVPVVDNSNLSTFMGMGIAKRLDGKPSQLSVSSPFAPTVGSASTSSLTTQPSSSPLSRKAPVPGKSNSNTPMGMGIPKRLDGKPSQLSVSSTPFAPREPRHRHECCNRVGSDSTSSLAPQPSLEKKKHLLEGLPFDSDSTDTHKFKPFTGKKYTFYDS